MNVEFTEGYVPCNCAICKRPFSDDPFNEKVRVCRVGHAGIGIQYAVEPVHPECLTYDAIKRLGWQ